MTALQVAVLILVGGSGTAVVLERNPLRQSVVLGAFGLLLALLFLLLAAPDVALSQLAVGAVAVPAMVLFALVKVKGGAG